MVGVLTFAFPFVSFASFDQNLSYGSKGQSVKELQDFLVDQGEYTGPSTGSFYSLTRKAVINFQVKNEIQPASGYFGNLTRSVANKILSDELIQSNNQALQETSTTTPNTEPTLKDTLVAQISLLTTQIQILQAQLRGLNSQLENQTAIQTQIQQNTVPIFTPIIDIPSVIQSDPVTCSVSASTNSAPASSFVKLSWTSSKAISASVTNNHVGPQLMPIFDVAHVSSGSQNYQLSSEAGESNHFVFRFTGSGTYKDCEVDVLTQ